MIEKNEELIKTKVLKDIDKKFTKEQKNIIKAPLDKNLLIQGVAGSGKSQIALNRIAYLICKNNLEQGNFKIISQNKSFLSYMSNILPELGLEKVKQQTFEDLVCEVLGRGVRIFDSKEKLITLINRSNNTDDENRNLMLDVTEYKGSLKFKEVIDRYLETLAYNIMPKKDFILANVRIIRAETVRELFVNTYKELTFEERLDEVKKYVFEKIKKHAYVIINEIVSKRSVEIQQLMKKDLPIKTIRSKKSEIFDKTEKLLQMLYKEDIKITDLYLGDINLKNGKKYYKDFIFNYAIDYIKNEKICKYLVETTSVNFERRELSFDDLAPIIYIHSKIFKKPISLKLKHLVIDDVQDYSEFQFYVLKNVLENESITMLGDLSQGVYIRRGVENWDKFINTHFMDDKPIILKLNKTHRISDEIIQITNKVINKLPECDKEFIINSELTINKTGLVKVIGMKSYDEIARQIARKIRSLDEKCESFAIIGKNLKECKTIRKFLGNYITKPNLIEDTNLDYKPGVHIIPSYLTKGFEYDYVVIVNASNEIYSKNILDIKLLYIALTRAKNKLDIYFVKNITDLIIE